MRIGYFGTPEHSKDLLEILHRSGKDIVYVVTNPDKPKGRNKSLTPTPVKLFANENYMPVYQPEKLLNSKEREIIKNIPTDIHIVYAYGQIIPEDIFNSPRLGSINLHGSVLPEYRGASPVQTALMDGRKETGYSIQKVAKLMDSGDIIHSEKFPILEDDNTSTIIQRITRMGAARILSLLDSVNLPQGIPQNHELATYCKKISSEDRLIHFHLTKKQIHDKVRALFPNPLAYTIFRGKRLILHRTSLVSPPSELANQKDALVPGSILKVGKKFLFAMCGDKNMISIEVLQLEGKNSMNAVDFLNGFDIKEGEFFS